MFLKRSFTFKTTCLIENLTHYKHRGFLTYKPLKYLNNQIKFLTNLFMIYGTQSPFQVGRFPKDAPKSTKDTTVQVVNNCFHCFLSLDNFSKIIKKDAFSWNQGSYCFTKQ